MSSDPPSIRSFVRDALADLGATVSDGESLVWLQVPETVRADLEVPAACAIAFDRDRSGEFDAELAAPGSYFLERLVQLVVRRGRWEVARCVPPPEWIPMALSAAGLGPEGGFRHDVRAVEERVILLFSFRVTLLSDEKREAFYMIAVAPGTGSAWEVDPARPDSDLVPAQDAQIQLDLEAGYRVATLALRAKSREALDQFRAASLRLLEEEVRRIFGYFDRTIDEAREADPAGSAELVRAIEGERDRRLAETLDRFDPSAKASVCALRAILAPTARIRVGFPRRGSADVTLDAWSRRVDGLSCVRCRGAEGPWISKRDGIRCARCASTRDGSARPRDGPRSDTPR